MSYVLLVLALLASEGDPGRRAEPGRGEPAPDDTMRAPEDSTESDYVFGGPWQPDPTGALLRSAVLPGWGQIYNREPLKGLALGAVELGLLAWLITEHTLAERARDDYLRTGDPFYEDCYQRHSGRRLDLIWYTSAAWLYGMLDAYVDAHLYGFARENRDFVRETVEDGAVGAVIYVDF